MLFDAGSYTLKIGDTEMDYACFGKGDKALIMIPGLSLKRVKPFALFLAAMYRCFAEDYRVYVFDRKEEIPEGYTVKDIADDIAYAMGVLHIEKADIFGVSQGGMVAQYLALEHPQLVNKLVLAVTISRENETVRSVIGHWIELTEKEDFEALVSDMMYKMYTDGYLKKYSGLVPILARMGRPKDPNRFIRLAKACVTCDTYHRLEEITCPVFVIGGKLDKIVTGEASEEIAAKLGCEIYMYEELGHSAYEEAEDFNSRIKAFLES
ncbi:MAG: alpha/beta hydrolase [Lachnospiraceae bacterium]|nr:alpha/beta hydrolase [Lachnospiraceae bacterium]